MRPRGKCVALQEEFEGALGAWMSLKAEGGEFLSAPLNTVAVLLILGVAAWEQLVMVVTP